MTVTAITLTITMTALNTAAIEYTMGNTFAVGLAGEKIMYEKCGVVVKCEGLYSHDWWILSAVVQLTSNFQQLDVTDEIHVDVGAGNVVSSEQL